MSYDARYYGTHCDMQITVTAYDIPEGRHPAPVLGNYKCPACKTQLTLVLIELGSDLGEAQDDDFDGGDYDPPDFLECEDEGDEAGVEAVLGAGRRD